ncbi:uncharacterized protein LJ206_009061 isoform 1-T1 [Theristicus caerulescens]
MKGKGGFSTGSRRAPTGGPGMGGGRGAGGAISRRGSARRFPPGSGGARPRGGLHLPAGGADPDPAPAPVPAPPPSLGTPRGSGAGVHPGGDAGSELSLRTRSRMKGQCQVVLTAEGDRPRQRSSLSAFLVSLIDLKVPFCGGNAPGHGEDARVSLFLPREKKGRSFRDPGKAELRQSEASESSE